jgi:hypothetical protein
MAYITYCSTISNKRRDCPLWRRGVFLFLILGGCAIRQASPPVSAPGGIIPREQVPVSATVPTTPPIVVAPVPPKIEPLIEPQAVPPEVSKDDFSQEYLKEHGQAVEVVTEPAGVKIELNGKPLGEAPGTFYMIRKPNRYGFLPRMTITAIPPEGSDGLYTQTRVFDGYTSTPERIYFDMTVPPSLPRIEDGY